MFLAHYVHRLTLTHSQGSDEIKGAVWLCVHCMWTMSTRYLLIILVEFCQNGWRGCLSQLVCFFWASDQIILHALMIDQLIVGIRVSVVNQFPGSAVKNVAYF